MKENNVQFLNLRSKTRHKIDRLILDNPDLKPDEYKYLFYLLITFGEGGGQRTQEYLDKIKFKIEENKKIISDEVVSAFLAIKLLEKNENELIEILNKFLENRIGIQYSPLSNLNNIFFLSNCFDLLSDPIQDKIQENINGRFKNKNILLFEFVLINSSKYRIKGQFEKEDEIVSRLLTYRIKNLSPRDWIYAEWFYQTILKNHVKNKNKENLKSYLQNFRKEYLFEITEIVSPSIKERNSDLVSINLFELSLLYEISLHLNEEFKILSSEELENILEEERKEDKEKIRKQDLQIYTVTVIAVFLFWFATISNILLRNLPTTSFLAKKIGISGTTALITFIELCLIFKCIEKSKKNPAIIERIWRWEKIDWVLYSISMLIGALFFYLTFILF